MNLITLKNIYTDNINNPDYVSLVSRCGLPDSGVVWRDSLHLILIFLPNPTKSPMESVLLFPRTSMESHCHFRAKIKQVPGQVE